MLAKFADLLPRITTLLVVSIIIGLCYAADTYKQNNTCIITLIIAVGAWAYTQEWFKFRKNEDLVIWAILGLIYLTPAIALSVLAWVYQSYFLIWMIGLTTAADVSAYFIGRLIGGPKLWPAVSPGKTQSGAIGGIISVMVVGYATAHWGLAYPPPTIVLLPKLALVALFGIAGDLLESGLKRRVGIKDSGNLFPGHGGALDRLDSHIVAIPIGIIVFYGYV
jgi:CDP-diglyceride synthetase